MVWQCKECGRWNPEEKIVDEEGNRKDVTDCKECGESCLE